MQRHFSGKIYQKLYLYLFILGIVYKLDLLHIPFGGGA